MERDNLVSVPLLFVLLVLTLTHCFEIDEEFEKEDPPNHNKWFPSVALQDSHAGASEVTISSIFKDWISAPQK